MATLSAILSILSAFWNGVSPRRLSTSPDEFLVDNGLGETEPTKEQEWSITYRWLVILGPLWTPFCSLGLQYMPMLH